MTKKNQTYLIDTSQPLVMGILNVTPDSFSDGGDYVDIDLAVDRALQMQAEGAAIIDIGGESTRPGAESVSIDEERQRVIPVIEQLKQALCIPISIDTSKPEIMLAATNAGAAIINDVNALRSPGAMEAAKNTDATICLMHMQGQPRIMQEAPEYENVTKDVLNFLSDRVNACMNAGIDREKLWIDPGFGFGKTLEHNYQLLGELEKLQQLNVPVLVGMSRKSMLGAVTGKDARERVAAGISATTLALMAGANIIRTHDVPETQDAIKVWQQVQLAANCGSSDASN